MARGALTDTRNARVAVLIPCYNEARTVGHVVESFRKQLPHATIYVYDNCSTDDTAAVARRAGAIVRSERKQGKGNVVRRMFDDIEAEVYVMVDGDDTYDAAAAPELVSAVVDQRCAMAVGRRVCEESEAYRRGHALGNVLFTWAVGFLFGKAFDDILSGYRAFSRAFVKSFPVFAMGFEIETELTIHSLTLKLPVMEYATLYHARPEGSASKLRTYGDGVRILNKILNLARTERPMLFYSVIAAMLWSISAILGAPLVITYLESGLVPRLPTGVLVTGLAVIGSISFVCGILLDAITHARREAKLLAYMSMSGRCDYPRETSFSGYEG